MENFDHTQFEISASDELNVSFEYFLFDIIL